MMLNTAVIGAGNVAHLHIEAVNRLGTARVRAVVDKNRGKAETAARKHSIPEIHEDYRAVLEDPDIDIVHCCLPNSMHYDFLKAALDAEKHILTEKPLCTTSREAREIRDIADRKKLLCGINFQYRYFPQVQVMKDRIQSGNTGRLRIVHASYEQDWLSRESDFNWRIDPAEGQCTAAAADIGSHLVDLIEYTTGKQMVRLFAHLRTLIPARRAVREAGMEEVVNISADDYGCVMFEIETGAVGSLHFTQVLPGKKNAIMLQVSGSEVSLRWEWEKPHSLWVGSREDPVREEMLSGDFKDGWRGGVFSLMAAFYSSVQSWCKSGDAGIQGYPSLADGVRVGEIVEAILHSHRESIWVDTGKGGS